MTIHLDAEMQRFVDEQARIGRFGEPIEVVRAALRLLASHTQLSEVELKEVRQKVREGLSDLSAGHSGSWDPEATWQSAKNKTRRDNA